MRCMPEGPYICSYKLSPLRLGRIAWQDCIVLVCSWHSPRICMEKYGTYECTNVELAPKPEVAQNVVGNTMCHMLTWGKWS